MDEKKVQQKKSTKKLRKPLMRFLNCFISQKLCVAVLNRCRLHTNMIAYLDSPNRLAIDRRSKYKICYDLSYFQMKLYQYCSKLSTDSFFSTYECSIQPFPQVCISKIRIQKTEFKKGFTIDSGPGIALSFPYYMQHT